MRKSLKFKNLSFPLLLISFVFIAFSPTLNNNFINLDDNKFIYQNDLIQKLDGDKFTQIFQRHWLSPWYKPLVYLSWSVENYFFGLNPKVFHLNNLLLHLFNTLLLFSLFKSILGKLKYPDWTIPYLAFFGALAFALHPMRVESVAWAMERKDVLFSFFFLSSTWFYLKYLNTKKYSSLLIGSLLFSLGLLSKSMIITLPLLLLCLDILLNRKLNFKRLSEKTPYWLVFIGGLCVYGVFSSASSNFEGLTGQSSIVPEGFEGEILTSVSERLLVNSYRITAMLEHFIYPANLSIAYPNTNYPLISEQAPFGMYVSLLILVFAIATSIFWAIRFKNSKAVALTAFFIISLLPVLAMPGDETSYISDRYTYIGSMALWLGILLAIPKQWLENIKIQKFLLGIGTLVVLILGILTHNRTQKFKNSITLFTDVIDRYPDTKAAYSNRGGALVEINDYQNAISDFEKLIELDPASSSAYNNLGVIYMNQANYPAAIPYFQKATELDKSFKAHYNLAHCAWKLKQTSLALQHFSQASLSPQFYQDAHQCMATILFNNGQYKRAIEEFDLLLQLNPHDFANLNDRGASKHFLKDMDGAIKDYKAAESLNPTQPILLFNLGTIYIQTGDTTAACAYFKKSLQNGYAGAREELKHCL